MQKEMYITLEGGIIQNIDVSKDLESIKVVVIDFDIDGMPNHKLIRLPSHESVFVCEYAINVIDDGDVEYFEELKKNAEI